MRRCGDCRWWGWPREWEENPNHDANVSRTCRLFSSYPYDERYYPRPEEQRPEPMAYACPWAGADGAEFSTDIDFGCSQFEARELTAANLRRSQ